MLLYKSDMIKLKTIIVKNNNINLLRIRYDEDIENRLINIFGIEE